jgi:hypothetical protein
MVTHLNLAEARREVEIGVKIRVLEFVEGVVHTRKWVSVLTRNLVKTAVVNAQSKRAISLAHKEKWRAELTVTRSNKDGLHCVFELSVKLSVLRK